RCPRRGRAGRGRAPRHGGARTSPARRRAGPRGGRPRTARRCPSNRAGRAAPVVRSLDAPRLTSADLDSMLSNMSGGEQAQMWGYEGRPVVVTGAASGIGRAVAEVLVSLAAEVHAVDLQPVDVEGIASSHRTDLTDPSSIDATVAALGDVGALFNCAGIPGTFDPRIVYAVNFCGLRHLTEQVVARMAEGGAVCSVGSASSVLWVRHVSD